MIEWERGAWLFLKRCASLPKIVVILRCRRGSGDSDAVEKKLYELQQSNRDAIANIPARVSGILAAESDQAVVFRLLTQEIVQAMEGLAGGPGA
jgi:hypothetical protein